MFQMKLCAAFLACHVVFAYLPSVHTSWWPFWSTESTEKKETLEKSQACVETFIVYLFLFGNIFSDSHCFYNGFGIV